MIPARTNLKTLRAVPGPMSGLPCRGELTAVQPDGQLRVSGAGGAAWLCDWLDNGSAPNPPLAIGDAVLLLPLGPDGAGVVLGRIGAYLPLQRPTTLTLRASESLTLQCGASSIDLRADGKVMVRGEDVLLRSKGTQRIRAGTVSIN